jgi:hypothetical protein
LGRPLDTLTANAVLNDIQDQAARVSTFYSIGTITVKDWKWDTDADMLIIGQKKPFKIKIEITHPWKGPVLHILIDDDTLEVLSFSDKKLYVGPFTAESLSKFIPGSFSDAGLIWSALRAYPHLQDHHKTALYEENMINLLSEDNREIETISLQPESLYPERAVFPDHGLDLTFSTFREIEDIRYAEDVRVKNINSKRDLLLKNKKMVFNQPIPEKIFTILRLPNYEIISMDEERDKPDL